LELEHFRARIQILGSLEVLEDDGGLLRFVEQHLQA
jgi:hypothetical protein